MVALLVCWTATTFFFPNQQSRTTIIAQHRAFAPVEVEPDYYKTLFLIFCQFYLISKKSHSIISQIQISLGDTGSESNFATNWISLTYRMIAKKLQLIDSRDEFNTHIFIHRTL